MALVSLPNQNRKRKIKQPAEIVSLRLDPFDSDNSDEYLIPSTPIEKTENVDLYYTEGECYIYKQRGRSNGEPRSNDSIIYDTEPNEVVAISNKSRTNKYYAQCVLPTHGYVYLPDQNYKNHDNDNEISIDQEELSIFEPEQNIEYEDHGLIQRSKTLHKRDYTAQTFIKIAEIPDKFNDPEYTTETPEENKLDKILQHVAVKRTILFFRTHPFLPGLVGLIFSAVIEVLTIIDLTTDIIVTSQLAYNPILFGISSGLVAAPFVIAWTVAGHTILSKYEKAHRKKRNRRFWSVILALYDVAPIGILMVFIYEVLHWIEFILIAPIYFFFTGGRTYRTVGYQEKGYYKLRKVSEVFAESLPQAIFQLCLLLGIWGDIRQCDKCKTSSVVMSLLTSSALVLLWCVGLFFESRANGISFPEYVAITFQGSFDFVPMLPAIEKGVESKGEFVNWSNFKIKTESFGQIMAAVYSKGCKLKLLKVSQYTIRSLRRLRCKFLGSRLSATNKNLQIIVSRVEQELQDFFDKYDLDQSGSFDFIEFVKIFLSVNSMVNERAIMTDIYKIWFKVADKRTNVIWMLDLLLKAIKATEYLPLIDYKSPLLHAYEKNNINLITFLIAANYQLLEEENHTEFTICVTRAVMENNIKLACVLCEHIGIPIVVSITCAKQLAFVNEEDSKYDEDDMNPYLSINLLGQEKVTQFCRETNNPTWNENVLFIIPFDVINDILESSVMQKSIQNAEEIEPSLLEKKSVQEMDEMKLRQLADNSYQRTKKRRKNQSPSKDANKQQYQLVNMSDEDAKDDSDMQILDPSDPVNYNFPKYIQSEIEVNSYKRESVSLTLARKLKRQQSDFGKYILQKEQCALIVTLAVYSKLFGEYYKNEEEKKDEYEKDENGRHDSMIERVDSNYDVKDKYIGKTYFSIDLSGDTSLYHEKLRTFELNHLLKKNGEGIECGEVSCHLYLNVLDKYHKAAVRASKLDDVYEPMKKKVHYTPMQLIIDKSNVMFSSDV